MIYFAIWNVVFSILALNYLLEEEKRKKENYEKLEELVIEIWSNSEEKENV